MTLGIWFGQFNISGGQVEEEGPFVGIFEGARQAAGVGVYVIAEPVAGAPARLCNEVLEVIARAFGNPEVALTANLLRAVAAAHDHVRAFNRLRPGDRAAGVGLSCLATRGDEAYLAQCGPTLVVANAGGRFRVAAPAGDDSRRPLGFGERAAPVFTRFSLHPGDVILLTFSAADKMLGRGALINLANSAPENALPDLYMRVRQADEFAALYLGVLDQPVSVEPSPVNRPAAMAHPRGGAPPFTSEEDLAPFDPDWQGRPAVRAGSGDRQEPVISMRERMAQSATVSRQVAQRALASLGQTGWQPSRRTVYLILGIVGLLLVLFIAMPALAERGSDGRYTALVDRATDTMTAARRETDLSKRRTLINQAEADLLEARALHGSATEVETLLGDVSDERAKMDKVQPLPEPVNVADLSLSSVATASPLEIAVAERVYVLDAGAGKVHAFNPEPGNGGEVVFEEGRTIAGVKVGKARHLTILPDARGGAGTPLILDANRRLFALLAGGNWQPVPLGDTQTWKTDSGITAAADALYALDAGANQVWRIGGDVAGFESRLEPLLARANLKDTAAISLSATPLLVSNAGRLSRIVDGRDQEFVIAGLDRPLTAPFAPIFNPTDGSLYVPDRGNARIVVASTDGAFQKQLVQRKLAGLRAIAFDEAQSVFYAVSGNSLLLFRLER